MIKSSSLSRVSQRKAADLQRRQHIANEPTPGEMLAWLKGVKRGHVLVLVNKTGHPGDACVDDVERHFVDVLDAVRPAGAGGFRRLMGRMLSGLVDVPPDARQAAQSLSEGLADEFAMEHGVVWTATLSRQLTALVDALERDRQARQDREGVDLLEPAHSARESLSLSDGQHATPTAQVSAPSGVAFHEAPDVVTDLVGAGICLPRLVRTTRTTASLRILRFTLPAKPKGDASE